MYAARNVRESLAINIKDPTAQNKFFDQLGIDIGRAPVPNDGGTELPFNGALIALKGRQKSHYFNQMSYIDGSAAHAPPLPSVGI